MSLDDVRSLLDAPSPAALVTYGADGSADVSPVWFRCTDSAFEVVVAADDPKLRRLAIDDGPGVMIRLPIASARAWDLEAALPETDDRYVAAHSRGVHGAQTIQQCLDAGLLDEIHVDLLPCLFGAGVRLFDHLANTPVVLGDPTVIPGVGVTHLRYPVHTS